jgi:hypothetical protein
LTNAPMSQMTPAAHFNVVLCHERGLEKRHVEDVVALFERHPGPVTVSSISKSVELKKAGPIGSLLWADTFAAIREVREVERVPAESFVYLLTKTANEHNWFATEDPENMRNGFGHLGDFTWTTSAPNSAIVSHYLLKGIFNTLVQDAGIEWLTLWHQKPRGCFFDFCEVKEDLSFKLRTADICGDCLSVFQSIGVPDSLLAQTVTIMETTRRQAINTGQFLSAEVSFSGWPFPVAITRHKAVQAANPLLRFMLLLDHFDSLVRYFYLAHEVVAGRTPAIEERPSLGWWVDQLAKSLKGERHFREIVSIAHQENVVALRNERRGHGWMASSEEAYRGEAENLERVLDQIEQELRPFLEKYRLVRPRQFRLQGGQWVIEGDHLVGSHILHPPFQLTLDSDPRSVGLVQENQVYLTDAKMEQFKVISPFIRYEHCPTCKHPRVLITDGGAQFIDVFMGHRVQLGGTC